MSIIDSILNVFLGDKGKKDVKEVTPIVNSILKIEEDLKNISNDDLRSITNSFKKEIQDLKNPFYDKIEKIKETISQSENIDENEKRYNEIEKVENNYLDSLDKYLDSILPKAFAVIKETTKRFNNNIEIIVKSTPFDEKISSNKTYVKLNANNAIWSNSWDAAGKKIVWDMIHYDVQLIGGIALHQGKIAEMQTGEGKTLVATLPVYLNALSGNGVHLITVNDYLAKRDCAWMAPIFEFHGLSVDCIDYYKPNSEERRRAYMADITYGTNNEFGFDYLRDNMAHKSEDRVQRQHSYSIVDEVDSVLIDDARTPLIISGPVPQGGNHEFNELKPKISSLVQIQRQLVTKILADSKKLFNEGNIEDGSFKLLQSFR